MRRLSSWSLVKGGQPTAYQAGDVTAKAGVRLRRPTKPARWSTPWPALQPSRCWASVRPSRCYRWLYARYRQAARVPTRRARGPAWSIGGEHRLPQREALQLEGTPRRHRRPASPATPQAHRRPAPRHLFAGCVVLAPSQTEWIGQQAMHVESWPAESIRQTDAPFSDGQGSPYKLDSCAHEPQDLGSMRTLDTSNWRIF